MRTCPAALETDIASKCTSLCRLWTITRLDGTILYFTDSDRPVLYSSNTYRSDLSFTTSAIFLSSRYASAQNVQMTVALDDTAISQDDIRQKRYRGAECTVQLINYLFPLHGTMILFAGTVGRQEISDKNAARLEFIPRGASAAGAIGSEVYSPTCRNSFGDSVCGKDLDALKATFTLTAVSGKTMTATEFDGQAANYWAGGYILWATGDNTGLRSAVATSATDDVVLVHGGGRPIVVGDTGTIFPGCDKVIETCLAKWANVDRFRGEPDVPDIAFLPEIPVTRGPGG